MSIDYPRIGLAVGCGFVADVLLVVAARSSDFGAGVVPLLFLFEALVLGWVFGPVAGGLAAALPFVAFTVYDLVRGGDEGAVVVSAGLAAVLILGGAAWLIGSLRDRYGRASPPVVRRTPRRRALD